MLEDQLNQKLKQSFINSKNKKYHGTDEVRYVPPPEGQIKYYMQRYEPLEKLADYGVPLIFYDQLGCGYSKVPKNSNITWNFGLFLEELENLITFFNLKKFNILGHSWGGMLALEWVCNHKHLGLNKLVLFSTLPSTKIWNEEHIKMLDNFPVEEKNAILCEFYGKKFDKKIKDCFNKNFH